MRCTGGDSARAEEQLGRDVVVLQAAGRGPGDLEFLRGEGSEDVMGDGSRCGRAGREEFGSSKDKDETRRELILI
jgi:hypothetical protein